MSGHINLIVADSGTHQHTGDLVCNEREADLPTLHERCHRIMKRRTARHLEFS